MVDEILNVAVPLAFREKLWESNTVSAVIVDGVFPAHPLEPSPLSSIEVSELRLVPPSLALSGAELGIHGRLAPIDVEAFVGGYEWSFGPVCLLQSTPRRPVICVPQTVVYLHGLLEWVSHSQVLAVLEHSDWDVIHEEPVPTFKKSMIFGFF